MVDRRRRNSKGIRQAKRFNVIYEKNVKSAQMLEESLIWSRNGAPSRKGCVVDGQMTKAGHK